MKYYMTLPATKRLPSCHPLYIIADACRDKSLEPYFFTYERNGNKYYHGFHISPIIGTKYYDIQSPYGYSGPISTTNSKDFLDDAWREYCHWCKEKNIVAEFIRFHPLLENQKIYGGIIQENRETIWIDLQKQDLLASYSGRMRTTIRKAMKNGLVVEWWGKQEFINIFPDLYQKLMQELQADSFYLFPKQYFDMLLDMPGIQLAVCKYGSEIVGSAIFLVDEQGMEYHLSATNGVGKIMSATSLLLHAAALLGKEKGCRFLHLGGGTDCTAENRLLYFKTGFSKNQGHFHIGYYIHQPDVYEQLKQEWIKVHGESSRILFYR